MADHSAEEAFLSSMQGGAARHSEESGSGTGEQKTQHLEENEGYTSNLTDSSKTSADDASASGAVQPLKSPPAIPNPAVADVSLTAQYLAPSDVSRPTSRASNQPSKAKTIGGFVVDADDEDEEDMDISSEAAIEATNEATTATTTTNGDVSLLKTSSVSQHSPSHSTPLKQSASAQSPPQNTVPSPNSTPQTVPNVAALLPNTGAGENTATPPKTLPVPQVNAVSAQKLPASLPKARLPHDIIGQLEDRIRDDPRGDVDAWLSLLSEHRRRNRIDDVRRTYDRFFKLFPSAVGFDSFWSCHNMLTCCRLTSGSHTRKWKST